MYVNFILRVAWDIFYAGTWRWVIQPHTCFHCGFLGDDADSAVTIHTLT